MQTPKTKKSLYIFEVLLDKEQLNELVRIEESLLKKFIHLCTKHFYKYQQSKPISIYIFLANYKQIIELHSQLLRNPMSVNLSLHFALLFTHHLLGEDRHYYAKAILKQTEEYLEIDGCDKILLSTCMNNLAILHLRAKKPRKALAAALHGLGLIEIHLHALRANGNRKRIAEDGVIFASLLLVGKRSIDRILCYMRIGSSDKALYKKLLHLINNMGYNFCLKYLGSQSLFTPKFIVEESSIDLPVYDETSLEEHPANTFEAKISQELRNIYTILQGINLQPEPEVYYIKQHLVEAVLKEKSQQKIIIIEELSPITTLSEPERSISYVSLLVIDDFNAELSILKTSNLSTEKEYGFLGNLQFKIGKDKENMLDLIITEDTILKILSLMNAYDVLPYEMEIKKLTNDEFIKRLLVHFLSVSPEKQLKIHPRPKPIIPPFQCRFCGENSLVFVNHVRFRKFRLAICPVNSCDTLYLQVEMRQKSTKNLFQLKELHHSFISALSKRYHPSDEFGKEQYLFDEYKEVVAGEGLGEKMRRILTEFEGYLVEEEEENQFSEGSSMGGNETYQYYQYSELRENVGQLHLIRYRPNINHLEVNIKNTFKTHTPAGEEYVRGSCTYLPQQFTKDFGISLKPARKYLPAFCQILVQKYSTKIYQVALKEEECDQYEENAILELPLASKCHARYFLPFEDYILPVTLELVSLNHQKPLGIRVTAFEPIKGGTSGLFISVTPEYWERPNRKEEQVDKEYNAGVKRTTEDYNFKRHYFLTNWLEQQGFKLIFERLTINNRALEMRGISSKFIRLDELLRER